MAVDYAGLFSKYKVAILSAGSAILLAVANGSSWAGAVGSAIADLIKAILGV